MSFLANHIQIRNGNYHDVISTGHKIDSIESTDGIEEHNVDGNDNGVESECIDFVITENEFEAYNDDDDENMFVELSDEDVQESPVHLNDASVEIVPKTPVCYSRPVSNTVKKEIQTAAVVYEDSELNTSEQHLPSDYAEKQNSQKISKPTESRCEDVIFGELVTSMLKKMDSPSRKRAKKEILNILLS